jgi:hypothetical protein
MAPDTMNDDLTAAITWALDRIVKGEYKEARDSSGNLDSMVLDKDFGPVNAAHARIGTSPSSRRNSESHTDSLATRGGFTAIRFANEIQNLLPGLTRRAEALRSVPDMRGFPEYVRRFLIEASRCIVYGHFLSALFLCRSALSEALVVTLRKGGHSKELGGMKEAGLKGIFKLAHDQGLLDTTQHQRADEVRRLANQAIHGPQVPSEQECLNAFAVTVDIVRNLST